MSLLQDLTNKSTTGWRGATSGTFTFSHTVANLANRVLILRFTGISTNSGAYPDAISFNGDALTQIRVGQRSAAGGNFINTGIWYLVAPDVGTFNVSITIAAGTSLSNFWASAEVITGAEQSSSAIKGNGFTANGSGAVSSVSVTGENANNLVLDITTAITTTSSMVAGLNQQEVYNVAGGSSGRVGTSTKPSAPSVVMSWNFPASREWCVVAVEVRPVIDSSQQIGVDMAHHTESALLGAVSSVTVAHTVVAGSFKVLFIFLPYGGTSNIAITSVTYAGRQCYLAKRNTHHTGTMYLHSNIYYLLDPPVGTANIVVQYGQTVTSQTAVVVALCLTNVDMTWGLIDRFGSNSANTGTTASVDLNLSTKGYMVLDCVTANGNPTLTVGGGQTQISNISSTTMHSGTSYEAVDDDGNVTMSWGLSSSNFWNTVAIVVKSNSLPVVPLGYGVMIDRVLVPSVQVGSLNCQLVLNGKSSLSCVLLNPVPLPTVGKTIQAFVGEKIVFGGVIKKVSLTAPADEAVKSYSVDCEGWEAVLERHRLNTNYSNQTTAQLLTAAYSDANLDDEGFVLGYLDPSGPTLTMADADYVRASEYMRDVANAGGGILELSPDKTIQYRKTSLNPAPFQLTSAEVESITPDEDMDEYCNQMTVRVTGTGGATTTITRADPVEIAARQSAEGGTGIYEGFEQVTHPTSNDVAELARLGISSAFLFMQARARVNRPFAARLRRALLEIGQLVTVNVPGMNLDGSYQISRLSITDEEAKLLFDIEASFTTRSQLNLDSLLRIVKASRATIVLPSNNFTNVVEFTSSTTWNVPGAGTVQVEIDVIGPGGGGGGGVTIIGNLSHVAGKGGNGGKAISFREYTAGDTLTIQIGTGGAGGAFLTDGSAGSGSTYVSSASESRVAEAFPGQGGHTSSNGTAPGADGSATGDYQFVGGGGLGGDGAVSTTGTQSVGSNGQSGKVIIRY